MKYFAGLWILFLLPVSVFADEVETSREARIVKIKGQRAILEFKGTVPPVDTVLKFNQYDLEKFANLEDTELEERPQPEKEFLMSGRNNSIDIFSRHLQDLDDGGGTTTSLRGEFGWNFGRWELGPHVSIGRVSTPNARVLTNFGVGGFVELNYYNTNRRPYWCVPALKYDFDFANSFAGGTNVTTSTHYIGTNLKFFFLRQSQSAIKIGFGYSPAKVSDVGHWQESLGLEMGIQTYF